MSQADSLCLKLGLKLGQLCGQSLPQARIEAGPSVRTVFASS